MPNWVANKVSIFADETLLAKIREEVKGTPYSNGEDRDFDFNQIAPIPTELQGTTSPTRIISQEEFDKQEERIAKDELTEGEKKWGVTRGLTQELVADYRQRFGHSDWYGWQNANWGTKWNASEVYWSDDSEYVSFNTAWSTPFALLTKLSEKYPEAKFEIQFADEDFGHNVGTYTLLGGVEIEENVPEGGSFDALVLAMDIHYGGVDEYFECNEEMFVEDFEDDDELGEYVSIMVDIAYHYECYPFEDCEYHKLVLERFKEKAMADEKYELVVIIQKELEKVIEE